MAQRKILKFEVTVSVNPNEDVADSDVAARTGDQIGELLRDHLDPMEVKDGWGNAIATARWAELKAL